MYFDTKLISFHIWEEVTPENYKINLLAALINKQMIIKINKEIQKYINQHEYENHLMKHFNIKRLNHI